MKKRKKAQTTKNTKPKLTYNRMVEQYELGNKVGLPQSFIDYYEKGYGKYLTPARIAEALQGYNCSEVVENPYTKRKVILNPKEVALYDWMKGLEVLMYSCGVSPADAEIFDEIRAWFRENNCDAYMTLID